MTSGVDVLSNRMSVEVIKLKFKTLCSITMRLYTCVCGESLSDLWKVSRGSIDMFR